MSILTNENYNIHIDNSMDSLVTFFEERKDEFTKVFILVDENTHEACIPLLLRKVEYLQNSEILEIDAGEDNKDLETATSLWYALLENSADRKTLIVNLGGGVVTDLGGFVASTFKRGIPFINVPTTLLGQIDAAVGSKTGVDLGISKNQVGAFAHPLAVFVNTDFINSLPDRELYSALGEFIKYALISDYVLWNMLINQDYGRDVDFGFMVNECLNIKNRLVTEDLNEKGPRKILNFGHTIGHAFESFALKRKTRQLRHGEAVALGIIVELYLSVKVLGFEKYLQGKIEKYILDNFNFCPINEKNFEEILSLMRKDKKNEDGKISFVLLNDIGKPSYDQFIDEELIVEALEYYANL